MGPRTVGKVKELLSSIYREDIRSGLVKIYYNGTLLQFKESPVYVEDINGKSKEWKKSISFTVQHEGKNLDVHGFVAIRIPGSVKDAGFTLIRRGRVIVGGSEKNYRPFELFGDANSYAWQRMYGELHMDNWPVTQAKDGFDWHNSGLEEAFIEALQGHTQDYRRKAESIRVRERINTHDLVKIATQEFTGSGVVENVQIEIVERERENPVAQEENPAATQTEIEPDEVVVSGDDGVVIEGGNQVNYKFAYKNSEYLFHIVFDMSDPTMDWLLVEQDGENEYTLWINMRHSFFKPLIEKREFLPIMMRMSIALVLAEIESMLVSPDGRIEPCTIRLKMNEILESVRKGDE